MGLNAIETYIPWNLHEPFPGSFRFSGMLDLRQFLDIALELKLLVIIRPGPYICSEWDLGGLPPYLLSFSDMQLRSTNPKFQQAMKRYFEVVMSQIKPYIGRPIVALQIENEYGAYGDDNDYVHSVLQTWQNLGISKDNIMLFTSDNGGNTSIQNGSPFDSEKVLKTINLEWNSKNKIPMLKSLQPKGPVMIAEFWSGWFDHWGESHHTRTAKNAVDEVNVIINDYSASINFYMFFGGTNFGYMAGANMMDNLYLPTTTSYDYDAFVTEYGAIRKDKFLPMQKLLRRFWETIADDDMVQATLVDPPPAPFLSAYAGLVKLEESVPLLDILDVVTDTKTSTQSPISMEQAGGDYGLILYRHVISEKLRALEKSMVLEISGVRDIANVIVDGVMIKAIDRNKNYDTATQGPKRIYIPDTARTLDILVENRGRINYGKELHDRKGILGSIKLDGKELKGFEIRTISFAQDHPLLRDVRGRKVIEQIGTVLAGRNDHPPLGKRSSPPTLFRGELSINPGSLKTFNGEFPSTHCRVFGRGILWVNGFNVGRFNTAVPAPQRSLFVPGALLREGKNEIVVLHLNMRLAKTPPSVQFFEHPDFGPTLSSTS